MTETPTSQTRGTLTAIWWLMLVTTQFAEAQIEHPQDVRDPGVRQTSAIGSSPESLAPPILSTLPVESIPDEKVKSFSLPISASLGFVGGDSLNMTSPRVGTSFPIYVSKGAGGGAPDLLVSLGVNFGVNFLDSQAMLDVPDTLFSTGGGLTVMKQLNPRWRLMGNFNASYQGDGKATEDVLNLSGMGMFQWEKSDRMQWIFGVAVTGQENLPVIPLAGFTWTPDDVWEVSFGLPQTKVARRIEWFGPQRNTWLYTGLLGIGGGTFAVQRNDGQDDKLTISGFPLAMGLETRGKGTSWFIESGLVVGRKLEYDLGNEKENLGEGFYSRIGIKF